MPLRGMKPICHHAAIIGPYPVSHVRIPSPSSANHARKPARNPHPVRLMFPVMQALSAIHAIASSQIPVFGESPFMQALHPLVIGCKQCEHPSYMRFDAAFHHSMPVHAAIAICVAHMSEPYANSGSFTKTAFRDWRLPSAMNMVGFIMPVMRHSDATNADD